MTAGAPANRRDTSHDVIITGRGDDEVTTGTRGHKNSDTVKTGRNRDTVEVLGIPAGAHIDGGAAANFLTPYVGRPRGHLTLDVARGVMRLGGRTVLHVQHLDDLTFAYPPSGGLTIRHDNRDGDYTYLRNQLGTATVTYHLDLSLGGEAHLLAGPDGRLVGRASSRSTSSTSTLQMTGHARRSATVNLDGWGTADRRRALRLSGFRWVAWLNSRAGVRTTIQGTSASEKISDIGRGVPTSSAAAAGTTSSQPDWGRTSSSAVRVTTSCSAVPATTSWTGARATTSWAAAPAPTAATSSW